MEVACSMQVMEVDSLEDLCCPPIGSQLWQAHPRVYLPVRKNTQSVKCYYCGTRYVKKATQS